MGKSEQKSLPKKKQVKYGENKTVTINKLPLGKYTEVLQEIEKMPEAINRFLDAKKDDQIVVIASVLADAVDDITGMLSIATGLDEKEIKEEVALDEAVEIIEAIFEVNRFFDLGKKWKGTKLGEILSGLVAPPKAGSSELLAGSEKEG